MSTAHLRSEDVLATVSASNASLSSTMRVPPLPPSLEEGDIGVGTKDEFAWGDDIGFCDDDSVAEEELVSPPPPLTLSSSTLIVAAALNLYFANSSRTDADSAVSALTASS